MKKDNDLPELLSVKETAAYIRSPQPSVYFLIKEGKIPAVRIGGRWKVKRRELDLMYGLGTQDSSMPSALIVEGDAINRRLYDKAFSGLAVQQYVAETGQQAIELASSKNLDIAFIDLELSGVSGEEIFEELRQNQPELPLVLVTAHPESETLSRILSKGPAMVLKKPIDLEQLRSVVRMMVRQADQAAA